MSSRAFRKLHGDADLFPDLKVESSEDDGEEDEVQPVGKNKKAGNLFDLVSKLILFFTFLRSLHVSFVKS